MNGAYSTVQYSCRAVGTCTVLYITVHTVLYIKVKMIVSDPGSLHTVIHNNVLYPTLMKDTVLYSI